MRNGGADREQKKAARRLKSRVACRKNLSALTIPSLARLSIIHQVLSTMDYPGKDESVIRKPRELILGGPEMTGSK